MWFFICYNLLYMKSKILMIIILSLSIGLFFFTKEPEIVRLDVGDLNQIYDLDHNEDSGRLYLSQGMSTSVYVRAVFSNGKQKFIKTSNKDVSFKIMDTTIATLSDTAQSVESFQIVGLKPEQKTDIIVSYKGITQKIEIITPACDMTMPCYK